jgi:signal transduction histidine kinase
MNSTQSAAWSGDYRTALQHFLQQTQPSIPAEAQELGERAVALGLDTLFMAKHHDHALAPLVPSDATMENRLKLTAVASLFFQEALRPLELTHPAAKEQQADLEELHETLDQRTADLAASNRALKQETAERIAATDTSHERTRESTQLLADSRVLEQQLQTMARRILSANEAERKSMSLRLNDELAQTLLGINMRMLALKQTLSMNQDNLNKEIAIIQRLVEGSVELIKQLAHEFSVPPSR